MAQLQAQRIWETSLIGRLVTFAFHTWDASLTGRTLGAIGRFLARVFEGSLPGRVWYSTWPNAREARESAIGPLVAVLASWFARVGDRLGGLIAGMWATSLLAGIWRRLVRLVQPYLVTSLAWQTFTGYAADVDLGATETGRNATSPAVYVLGAVLGLAPLIPSDFRISPTVLMIVGVWGAAGLWIVRKLMLRDYSWRGSSAFLPFAFFLLVAAATTVQSVSRKDSLLNLVIWLTGALLFWMCINLVRNTRDAAVLLGPVLVGSVLLALWAVYQFIRPPVIEESWVDQATSGDIVRSFASFGNPNYLAEYMTLYLPLAVGLWLRQPKRRLEMTLLTGAMVVALLLTYSRGGWLAAMIAFLLLILMRAPRYSVFFFVGALAAPLVAPESIIRRVVSAFTTADTSNAYRLNLWRGIGEMLKKFWVLGAGLGAQAFSKVYQEFMLPEARAAHAHNTYLEMFAEVGILGLIAMLWLLLAVIRRTFNVGTNTRNSVLIAAVPAAMTGLLFHGLVEHIWYNPKLLFAFWAVAGLGMGMALGDREDAKA